jgi:hypothetical protein
MTAPAPGPSGPRLPRRSRAGFRLAFTLAARNARRAPGRSFLIAVLVALPVIGLAGAATVGLSMVGSPAQTAQAQLGHMAASMQMMSNHVRQTATSAYPDGYGELTPTDPTTWLPSDWRVVPISPTGVYLRTAHGVAEISATAGRSWDPAFRGRFDLLSGHAPRGADEILASPSALARLGARVSDTVRTPDATSYRIVGTMLDRTSDPRTPTVFGGRTAFSGLGPDPTLWTYYLAGPPVTLADIHDFNRHGAFVLSLAATAPYTSADLFSAADGIIWSYAAMIGMVGGFMLFEVALLAGAGFLVGARQEQRALAVLASVGADRRLLSRSVAVGGIVIGALGALGGITIGVGLAAIYMAVSRTGSTMQYYTFGVSPVALGLIALVAVFASWIAAAVPGRTASRFDVVSALRGARRPPRPSRLAPALGVVVMLVGIGIAVVGGILTLVLQRAGDWRLGWLGPTLIAVGSIVLELGAILGVPVLLRAVARLGARNASARMATRDLARNSARAVPAVAAVMSTIFVAAFLMAALSGGERQSEASYLYQAPLGDVAVSFSVPDPAQPLTDVSSYRATLERVLGVRSVRTIEGETPPSEGYRSDATTAPTSGTPVATVRPDAASRHCLTLRSQSGAPCALPPYVENRGNNQIVVGDQGDLAAVLGQRPSSAAVTALRDGGAVSLYPQFVEHGKVTLDWWTPAQLFDGEFFRPGGTPQRSRSVDAVIDPGRHPAAFGVIVSPETAHRLGLHPRPIVLLARPSHQPSQAQLDELAAAVGAGRINTDRRPTAYSYVENGPQRFAGTVGWIVLGVAGLITLGASVVALGLARNDARPDELTLGAVGAPPRTLRGIAFWQALVLAGLGSIVGGAFALVPAYAMSLSGQMAFAPPWLQLGATAVGVPLMIAVVTALTRRVRRPAFVDRTAIG